jgi:hypothetical protein
MLGRWDWMGENAEGANCRIEIGAYGNFSVEASTKEECLELFNEIITKPAKR